MTVTALTTRAAVWHGDGRLRVESWDLPALGPDDVLVEVAGCGVCGSDLHVVDGGFPGLEPPVVLGHEPVGTIAAVGAGVGWLSVGDKVTWEPNVPCGHCFFCRDGRDVNLCENRVRVSGSFAERTVVPARAVHRLAEDCPPEVAIMAEPLSCALYAFERAGVTLDETVAIVGAGTIGLLLLMLARRAGAKRVLVADPNPGKRAVAQRLGADAAVDPLADDLAHAAGSLTEGRGFDVAFEAVGKPVAVESALSLPRAGGRAVMVGASRPGEQASLDLVSIQRRDLTISACWVREHTFQRAVSLLASLPVAELVTHEVKLDNVAEALDLLRRGEAVKVAVVP